MPCVESTVTRFGTCLRLVPLKGRRMFGHQLMGRSSGFGWWFLLYRVVIVTWFLGLSMAKIKRR